MANAGRPARSDRIDVTDSLRDGWTFPVFSMDQAGAVPQLPRVPVHHVLRDLDRGFVVIRFDPFGRRDLGHPVEAVKSIAFHCTNPVFRAPRVAADMFAKRALAGLVSPQDFRGFPAFSASDDELWPKRGGTC